VASPLRAAVVVDASVAIKWLLEESGTRPAVRLLAERRPLLAPDLMLIEAANALWKKVRRGEMPGQSYNERSVVFWRSTSNSMGVLRF